MIGEGMVTEIFRSRSFGRNLKRKESWIKMAEITIGQEGLVEI